MTQSVPTHAVIIPHYNDVERLSRCLLALVPQLKPGIELVVVDNSSTQSLERLRVEFAGVKIVTEPAKGAALARNRGVAETSAPVIIFLDSDCIPAGNWLDVANHVNTENQVVGGRVDVFDETPAPKSGAEAFETVFAFQQRDYITRKNFSVTANLVTSRAVFERTGPFVAGLSEDVDWCRRAIDSGARLQYDDTMVVAHPTRQNWADLKRKWVRLNDEMYQLHGTGPTRRVSWAVRGAIMLPSILAHAPKIAKCPALSNTDKFFAFATLARLRTSRCLWMLRQAISKQPAARS